ncbi:hypothetical protein FHT40_005539 [Mycolicibacterium sp. BK556]|uniref:hypothetical protein n=1 Tax=unclassified Mycolicibacterium TaxID=2636767 RepID=UPI00161B248A|nr:MULTISPECIES: hypothetical protein [unclassified Mycolicibacterium]MBB3605852.1 hypothetical protein [Mycolicibacterium sp. BK556]MBB3635651.1 hypothetical protein [Mycolicibacterium sp. BK607]MBB3753068.1 hypothetical protein [Mycolicibacterium sp. BK634]
MAITHAFLAGLATSVLAAGMVTANSEVTQEASTPALPGVELTGTTIPIIDFYGTLGPLSILRTLTLEHNVAPNVLNLKGEAGTAWNPAIGPTFTVGNSFELPISRTSTTAMVDLGFKPEWTSASLFQPIGAAGPTIDLAPDISSEIHLIEYRGGTEGYGFGMKGSLVQLGLQGGSTKPTSMLGGAVTIGQYETQLSVLPTGGLKAALSFSPYFGGGGANIELGTTKIGTTLPSGKFAFDTKLCLGSAAASCGGVIAEASMTVALGATVLKVGNTEVFAYDLALPDGLKVELKSTALTVTGKIGATVTIANTKVGGISPINITIPIPPAPAVPSVSALRKTSAAATVSSTKPEHAPKAASRKSVSNNKADAPAGASPTGKGVAKSNRPARD